LAIQKSSCKLTRLIGRDTMTNDEYFKQQADRVRAMADKADPFTKKRLLDLADRYDAKLGKPSRATRNSGCRTSRTTPGRTQQICRRPQPLRDNANAGRQATETQKVFGRGS
jgi:hypothetical protein